MTFSKTLPGSTEVDDNRPFRNDERNGDAAMSRQFERINSTAGTSRPALVSERAFLRRVRSATADEKGITLTRLDIVILWSSSLLFMSNPLFRHNLSEFSFSVSDVAIPFFKHKVTSGACGRARFGPIIKDGLIPILVRGPKNSVLLHPSD
jgi:hypothetical protein